MPAKKISFEQALEELNQTVSKLESGEASLEESLELFKKGVALTSKCTEILNNAEQQIKIIENGGNEE